MRQYTYECICINIHEYGSETWYIILALGKYFKTLVREFEAENKYAFIYVYIVWNIISLELFSDQSNNV